MREPDPPAVQPVEPRISAPLVSAPPPPPPPVSTSGSDAADDIASSAINPDVAGVVYSDQVRLQYSDSTTAFSFVDFYCSILC